ncbi:hypothetical protein JN535_08720 [Cellulosimicrobium cellulans]|uniref:hypothetical protein n=1 Tax=Cellulosimicrobium cellulans TaxID=1710 RepID=UPI00196685C8|nr:hypothetical protein [Cellulosimicrobium cellulans]MBN0040245.1 hypothetical protein [Cellulosimicrobium cellulans]
MTVQIEWFGGQAKQARKASTARGLGQAAEFVLGEARKEVPIEEAVLSRSGAASVDAEMETAAVSFDTAYAVIQHERLDFRHDRGRKAKYLEDPVTNTREKQAQIIARAIEQGLT